MQYLRRRPIASSFPFNISVSYIIPSNTNAEFFPLNIQHTVDPRIIMRICTVANDRWYWRIRWRQRCSICMGNMKNDVTVYRGFRRNVRRWTRKTIRTWRIGSDSGWKARVSWKDSKISSVINWNSSRVIFSSMCDRLSWFFVLKNVWILSTFRLNFVCIQNIF